MVTRSFEARELRVRFVALPTTYRSTTVVHGVCDVKRSVLSLAQAENTITLVGLRHDPRDLKSR